VVIIQKKSGEETQFNELPYQDVSRQVRSYSEEEQTAFFAAKQKLPYLDLNIFPVDIDTLNTVSEDFSRNSGLLIIQRSGKNLKVATLNPKDPMTQKAVYDLEKKEGFLCRFYIVSKTGFNRTLQKYKVFNLGGFLEETKINLSGKDLAEFEEEIKELSNLQRKILELPTTKILNIIIAGALKVSSSDIHLEPQKENVRLRYRIDGVLQNICFVPYRVYPYVLSRVKMIAQLKLNIKDQAQDGRFEINLEDAALGSVDVRVSLLPGNFGENIVMRLLNQDMSSVDLDQMGLRGRALDQLLGQIEKPNGMILNTGPTGSGKTTTLYACLKRVNSPSTKIITIEDPIEYKLPGISQTQVHKERGYDFATGLRSIVRQDPDVILVGEIRDEETADIATHAALTGHLVFSTVHANSSSGAIPRLVDLGVRPSLIGPSCNIIIAQRLVRRLCPDCKEEYVPASGTLETIGQFLSIISPKANLEIPKDIKTLFRAVGCPKCHSLGYRGRIGIFEVLEINKNIEDLIIEMKPDSDILSAAMEDGMVTLLQDGILKAVTGETSMEEIQRATGSGEFLKEIYDNVMSRLLSLQIVLEEDQLKDVFKTKFNPQALAALITSATNQNSLEYVIGGALYFDAGDIHLEPEGDGVKIRFRIDGILQDIGSISGNTYFPLLGRIKNLSGFKASSHQAVRDSRFGIKLKIPLENIADQEIDARVSIITGGYGETVVIRLLHKSARSLDINAIGIRSETLSRLLAEVEKPNGIILNTGPTGSGKTTTLYSLLNKINTPERKIITVEDPIEYRLKGVLQTQINTEEGYDFSSALRALLRQNPDVLMIGEIRDEETAKIAIQASLTGHLVLSSLHTNNAVASVQRLLNMNIDPSDIASATNALMAQRLVRRLCPECKRAENPSPEVLEKIKTVIRSIPETAHIAIPQKIEQIFVPVGCLKCKNTGYSGIAPVTEVMVMSEALEELISRFSTTSVILKQAVSEGMLTMAQDGVLKVVEGITSMAEIIRATEE
jgi:type II secretory ATPase GspE/PulE/Tfp pilus assembly ATPase PilB-like protein